MVITVAKVVMLRKEMPFLRQEVMAVMAAILTAEVRVKKVSLLQAVSWGQMEKKELME